MSAGRAHGHAIEQVWIVEATHAPEAAETRVPFRAEHLVRIARLQREGPYLHAGLWVELRARQFGRVVPTSPDGVFV